MTIIFVYYDITPPFAERFKTQFEEADSTIAIPKGVSAREFVDYLLKTHEQHGT